MTHGHTAAGRLDKGSAGGATGRPPLALPESSNVTAPTERYVIMANGIRVFACPTTTVELFFEAENSISEVRSPAPTDLK